LSNSDLVILSKTKEIDCGRKRKKEREEADSNARSSWQKREKDKIMLSMKCTEGNQIKVYDLIRVKIKIGWSQIYSYAIRDFGPT